MFTHNNAHERRLIEDRRLTLFADQLLEAGHDFIPPRNDGLKFILRQVMLSLLGELLGIERLEFLQQLAVTAHQIVGVPQVSVCPEGTSKINSPDFPVLADEDIGKVGIVVVNQLVKNADSVHLVIPRIDIGYGYFLL